MNSSDGLSGVDLLVEEFMERQQRGENPTVEEYCQRHPELADEIRDVFEALMMVEELKPSSQDESGTLGGSVLVDGQRLDQVGDYRILCEIGRGGMGVVYEAEQLSLGRRVALKVLPRQLAGDGKSLARFQREAKAAARMHHTNIVPVFEVGNDNEHVFYAMQLIHGQGLDLVIDELSHLRQKRVASRSKSTPEPLDRKKNLAAPSIAQLLVSGRFRGEQLGMEAGPESSRPLPDGEAIAVTETIALRGGSTTSAMLPGKSDISTAESDRRSFFKSVAQIGQQTASALSYAHARGIIHRDIKPSNLLLDAAGVVWVTDFGLAKTGDHGLTHTGDILGTIRYMSPERFRGQCDVRADIYSLGITLYELLTLKPAFASVDQMHLIEHIRNAEPPPPRSLDARIPRDLETIILKSIDKDPKRRYQSADDMADDLSRFIRDEPIQARRVSLLERFTRWSRRNKALAASLSTIATLLVVIAVSSVSLASYFRQMERAATLTAREKASLADEMTKLADANRELADEKDREADNARTKEQEAVAAKEIAVQAEQSLRRELYLSDMQEARQAYHEGAANRVEELLKKYVPIEGESDQRGWEWYYWWRANHRHVRQLEGGGAPFYYLAVSPDKTWFAVRQWYDSVRIHDARTQRTINTITTGPWVEFRKEIAISPDGRFFAAIGNDARVKLWRTDDWSELPSLQHESMLWAIDISADGLLAAGERTGRVTFWSLEEQSKVGAPLETGQSLTRVAFSPDGDRLATGHYKQAPSLTVWNVAARDLDARLVDMERDVVSLAWAARGERSVIAAGFGHGYVRLWDGQTYSEGDWLTASGPVVSLAFSPDGDRLVAGTSRTNSVHVWKTDSAQLLGTAKGHSQVVWGVGFADDGPTVWSSSEDSKIKTWKVSHSGPFDRLSGATPHMANDPSLTFSVDGQSLWRGGMDGPTHHWKLSAVESLPEFDADESHKRASFSPNGRFEAVYTQESNVEYRLQVYRIEAADRILLRDRLIPNENVGGPPDQLTISNDGAVVAWSRGASLVQFNLSSGRHATWTEDGYVESLTLSPDGALLAALVTTSNWVVRLWKTAGEAPVLQSTLPGEGPVNEMCFSPDGLYLALALWNNAKQIQLYNAATGDELATLRGHAGPVVALDFSRDGRHLVSGGRDGTVRLWDVARRSLLLTLDAHERRVVSVAFSPDGQTIASIAADGDARLWRGGMEDAQDADYWAWLADEQKSSAAALAAWTEAIRLSPGEAEFYLRRGEAQMHAEQFSDAMADFRMAFEVATPVHQYEFFGRIGKLAADMATFQPLEKQSSDNDWRFVLEKPAEDWQHLEFDDTAWETGGPRFETGSPYGWPNKQIWLRKEFHLGEPLSEPLTLCAFVDDGAMVYVNGTLAANVTWAGREYQYVKCQASLRPGRNVIAVHCTDHNDRGTIHIIPGISRYDESSLAVLSTLLESDPENETLLRQRADVYSTLGRWDEAAADFFTTLQIRGKAANWTSGPGWNTQRSNYLLELTRQEALFDALRRQLPDANDVWLARARNLALRSEWSTSAEAFGQYCANVAGESPIESEIWFEIACLHRILGDDQGYQQCLTRFREQAGESPDHFDAFVLARIAGLGKQTAESAQQAVRWGELSLTDDPRPWKDHALGLALLRAGEHDAAIAKLNESLAADWYDVLNQLALALVHHATGDEPRAQELLREAQRWRDEQLQQAGEGTVGVQVIDWLAFHALLREAEKQIAAK